MQTTAQWAHRLSLGVDPASTGRARSFVKEHLVAHGLPHLVDDVRLVVSELATNAMVHAATPFTVLISAKGPAVTLTVEDGAAGAPGRKPQDEHATSGRGLAIVEEVSRSWGVATAEDGTKAVWASFER
jgi:anti-sigma regulatory factor (Ser/Thr protein kinase)